MKVSRQWRLAVASILGLALTLTAAMGCDSGEDPTPTVNVPTPVATVRSTPEPTTPVSDTPIPESTSTPSAVPTFRISIPVAPTATAVKSTPTQVATVSVGSPTPTATRVPPATSTPEPTLQISDTPTSVAPSPTPTPAPTVTATVQVRVTVTPTAIAPTPTATSTVVVVELPVADEETDVAELTERVYELAIWLAEELSPRQSATNEELQAAEYLLAELADLGYEVVLQDFEVDEAFGGGWIGVLPGPGNDEPAVTFSSDDGDTPQTYFLPFEPLKSGRVQGELVYAGLGAYADFEGIDVDGKIVLMRRGTLTFEEKETNAAERGAVGAVVYNNQPRFYFSGRLEQPPDIVVGGIRMSDGELLQNTLDAGEPFSVELLAYPIGNGPSRNVVAELNNDIVGDQVVIIGAHYDTTPWSPGANDNGSGIAAAMIVADELADDVLPFDLRIVLFGSEETGLHGSHHYAFDLTQPEIDRIAAMINLDVIGAGDLEAFGAEELTDLARDIADDFDFEFDITAGFDYAASDYAAFDERDVPYLMFLADDTRFINHPSDTIDRLDAEPMGQTVAIILELIDQLADSIEP